MLLLLLLLLLTHLRARARISPESPKLETTRSLLIFGRAYYRKDICVLDLAGGGGLFLFIGSGLYITEILQYRSRIFFFIANTSRLQIHKRQEVLSFNKLWGVVQYWSVNYSSPFHLRGLFVDITGSWGPSAESPLLMAFQLVLSTVVSFDEEKLESNRHEEGCI